MPELELLQDSYLVVVRRVVLVICDTDLDRNLVVRLMTQRLQYTTVPAFADL